MFIFSFHDGLKKLVVEIVTYFLLIEKGEETMNASTRELIKRLSLRRRIALEVYLYCMRNFHLEFDELFESEIISEIEIRLDPYGEPRYPSYTAKFG